MRFYDDISFKNASDEIAYLKKLKTEFDILDFFNKKVTPSDKYFGKYSGVIVITPEQMITVYPVFLHDTTINFIYYLLYNECDGKTISQTNNIIIKLVNGRCKLFNACVFPESINEYQKIKMQLLLDRLKDFDQSIMFGDEGSLACFKETYDDACAKLRRAVVVPQITNVLKDEYVIDNDQKSLKKAVGL